MAFRLSVLKMGRFQAVHFFWLATALCLVGLSGCSTTSSPLWSTLGALVPGGQGNIADQARKIPYGTIDFSFGRRGGLLVLAKKKNALTFWQTGRNEVVMLAHGDLQAMAGLLPRLTMSDKTTADGSPVTLTSLGSEARFRVVRSWRDKKGGRHSASARARWSCADSSVSVKLPLATRSLFKCVESLHWADGSQTQSVYWRGTERHIWKAEVAAWPGAPKISWQVARPWWDMK